MNWGVWKELISFSINVFGFLLRFISLLRISRSIAAAAVDALLFYSYLNSWVFISFTLSGIICISLSIYLSTAPPLTTFGITTLYMCEKILLCFSFSRSYSCVFISFTLSGIICISLSMYLSTPPPLTTFGITTLYMCEKILLCFSFSRSYSCVFISLYLISPPLTTFGLAILEMCERKTLCSSCIHFL
jgi:hypothetical protein